MASVVISDKGFIPSKIKSKNYPLTKLDNLGNLTTVIEIKDFLLSVKEKDYPVLEIRPDERMSIVNQILPFRVRFENIGILSTFANIPGIGIQVIGINNYIL